MERTTGKVKVVLAPDRGMHGMVLLREGEIEIVRLDCVFPVLHGVGGEDGTMRVCSSWPAFRTSAAA